MYVCIYAHMFILLYCALYKFVCCCNNSVISVGIFVTFHFHKDFVPNMPIIICENLFGVV